jgi:MFS transporter, ACS family, hexuronate transporter
MRTNSVLNQSTEEKHTTWYGRNWRWFVAGTLFFGTFLNYFDRQTLGIAMDPISQEFGLDNIQRGNLLSAFIFAYAFTHLFVGFIVDRLKNIKLFFPIMVIGWGLSTSAAGFAQSYTQMYWLRVILGVLEAVNFPICLMIIARIFPARERTLAAGIFASGAFLATLAAPPVVIYFAQNFSWRYSFFVAGITDFLWLIPWFLIFRNPEKRSAQWRETEIERRTTPLRSLRHTSQELSKDYKIVLKAPGFWAVALIGLGIIPSLYFATQWFPSYFTQSLGHPYDTSLSYKLMTIYFMQDIGLWAGGAVVLWLAKKRLTIMSARKIVIVGAYFMMMSVVFVPFINSMTITVILLSVYVCGIGAFLGNQHAFKQDVIRGKVATVAALVGFIETGFTAFIIKEIGVLTNVEADFTPVFLLLAGLATFSIIIVMFMIKPKWIFIE